MAAAGVYLAIYGLSKNQDLSCPTELKSQEQRVVEYCSKGESEDLCKEARQLLVSKQEDCSKKTLHPTYLFFLVLIPLGVFIVFLAKFNKKLTDENKAWGAIQGTVFWKLI